MNKLTDTINREIKASIPSNNCQHTTPTLTDDVKKLIEVRNRARRLYQTKQLEEHRIIRNQLAREIKQQIKTSLNNSWETKLKSLNIKKNLIWKIAKTFTKQTSNTIPTLHGKQGLALNNRQKVNALAEKFEKAHHLTGNMGKSRLSQLVNTKYKEILAKEIINGNIVYVTPNDIMLAIKSTKPKKVPGPDGIQNIVLKRLSRKSLVQLTHIFNSSFKLAYFPNPWKHANVLAFLKPGKDKLFP